MIHLFPVVYVIALTAKMVSDGGILTTRAALREDVVLMQVAMLAWAALGVVLVVAVGVGSAAMRWRADRRRTRDLENPAIRSAMLLERASGSLPDLLARMPDALDQVDARLRAIAPRWDHESPAFQRISRDLDEAVRTLVEAADGSEDPRSRIGPVAAAALGTLAQAAEEAAMDRTRHGEDQARVLLRYLSESYGSDAGGPLGLG
jgi:hypothetical protein